MKSKPQPQKQFDMEAAGSLTPELEYAPHSKSHVRTDQHSRSGAVQNRRKSPTSRGDQP